jgi:hypothetical protein
MSTYGAQRIVTAGAKRNRFVMAGMVERAYELARSSEYQSISKIRERLSREGYSSIEINSIGCRHLRGELIREMKAAKRVITSPS